MIPSAACIETEAPRLHTSSATLVVEGITYTRHPLSALFGNLSDEDYALLKSSIEQVGQQRPILLAASADHRVLDGWNRLRALSELGLPPVTRRADAGADEVQLVTAVNLAQRTLSAGQRALIAARLASYSNGGRREGAGRTRQADLADGPSAADHDAESFSASSDDISHAGDSADSHQEAAEKNQSLNLDSDSFADGDASADAHGKDAPAAISLADAADRLGVSRAYVARARTVAEKAAPEVLNAVQRGELSLNEAAEVAAKPVETQLEYIARRIKEGTAAHRQMAREAAPRQRAFRKHVEKHSRPPADATPDEIDSYVLGLLVGTRTNLNRVANWIEDGVTQPTQSEFDQFFGAINRLRDKWERAMKTPRS